MPILRTVHLEEDEIDDELDIVKIKIDNVGGRIKENYEKLDMKLGDVFNG